MDNNVTFSRIHIREAQLGQATIPGTAKDEMMEEHWSQDRISSAIKMIVEKAARHNLIHPLVGNWRTARTIKTRNLCRKIDQQYRMSKGISEEKDVRICPVCWHESRKEVRAREARAKCHFAACTRLFLWWRFCTATVINTTICKSGFQEENPAQK